MKSIQNRTNIMGNTQERLTNNTQTLHSTQKKHKKYTRKP